MDCYLTFNWTLVYPQYSVHFEFLMSLLCYIKYTCICYIPCIYTLYVTIFNKITNHKITADTIGHF